MNVTQSETASVTTPENCGFKCERTWARIPAVGPRANYTASLSLIVLICEMGRLLTFLFHVSFKESKNYSIWKSFIHDAVLNSSFLVWDKSLKVCNVSKRNHACFLCLPQNNNFFFFEFCLSPSLVPTWLFHPEWQSAVWKVPWATLLHKLRRPWLIWNSRWPFGPTWQFWKP